MEATFRTLDELALFARDFVTKLSPKEGSATLVTLSGELGAGKTAFAQALAEALGVTYLVTSPTFVLEKIYALPEDTGRGFMHLIHIDAYRLRDSSELAALGFDEVMSVPENLVLLEWPENVRDTLHAPAFSLTLTAREDDSRSLSLSYG
ncbi:MAG: tRNA (adenosine(37)-N6)-threonylcarbamoyltransferase complex ATPase subunit type 1 TsaE [Minisyncoccia bacterium]